MTTPQSPTKTCLKCDTEKPLEDFNRNRTTGDGWQTYCRTCDNKYATRHRLQIRQDPERATEMRVRYRTYYRAAGARYPEKQKARHRLNYAIERGKILKPKECSCCDRITPSRNLHGHHADYDKPLQVEWLCAGCHGERTRGSRWPLLA